MSDFTPIKGQVKGAYVRAMRNAFIASEGEHGEEFERFIAQVRAKAAREAWAEADHAHYPLVMAVESFIDNGGDTYGNLDDAFERVSDLRNPYDAEPKEAPEVLPGTLAALNALTIRKEPTND